MEASQETDGWDDEATFQRDRARLWESLNSRKRLDVDSSGLHRLLSFVENPTFREASFLRRQKSSLMRPLPLDSQQRVALKREDTLPMEEAQPPPRRKIVLGLRPAYDAAPLPPIPQQPQQQRSRMGGTPITKETALRLRQIVLGNSVHAFCKEWRRAFFSFQEASGPHPYGLSANRDGTRSLVLCVQAQLLRALLFPDGYQERHRTHLLAVEPARRPALLTEALAQILWRAGERRRAALVAPSDVCYVPTDGQYKEDGLTEKLHLFYFTSLPDLMEGLRRMEVYFTSPIHPGCILFLYSLVLSRGFLRLQSDWDAAPKAALLNDNEELETAAFTLALTGAACRYLHNGRQVADPETGALLDAPRTGLTERPDVGLLQVRPVGTMLRSPRYPIWLVRHGRQAGLLFSTHSRLMEHWRSETSFTLYYFTGLASQFRPCRLTVDTRSADRVATARKSGRRRYRQMLEQMEQQQQQQTPRITEPDDHDEQRQAEKPGGGRGGHLLERVIQSRWPGAQVEWPQGVSPFF